MLWIAFKLYNFDTLKTTLDKRETMRGSLWIAFKLYNFDTLKTTKLCLSFFVSSCELLSNFITLTHWKQLNPECTGKIWGCELLSNFITLTHWKQQAVSVTPPRMCCELLSNFITLTHWKQLRHILIESRQVLWIAFKLYNFDTLKTTLQRNLLTQLCCELLSNFITLTHWKQPGTGYLRACTTVVNCFQTL